MQLILHPTRHEALTASGTTLTRWSLSTNPASILCQVSTAPESVFRYFSDQQDYRGITSSPDGLLFAHRAFSSGQSSVLNESCALVWRSWDDLSIARTSTFPFVSGEIFSLACSPDGRWLVVECIEHSEHIPHALSPSQNVERLFLLDWHTGEIISRHDIYAFYASSLAFDPTSTFVAANLFDFTDNPFPTLWRMDPAELFKPRPAPSYYSNEPGYKDYRQDEVSGSMALTALGGCQSYELIFNEDEARELEIMSHTVTVAGEGLVSFSPQGQLLLYSFNASMSGGECVLIAYAVPSGKVLWGNYLPVESSGQAIFSPDGSTILLPEQSGDLLVYRAEDGELIQRLPTGCSEPIQALAFDHDGKTLWLATAEKLVQYQPKG